MGCPALVGTLFGLSLYYGVFSRFVNAHARGATLSKIRRVSGSLRNPATSRRRTTF